MLTNFLILTIIFWFAGNFILNIFLTMIQPEGALDIAFGWQNMLKKLYGSESKWKQLAGKALGDCQMCTAFWFMPFWFVVYCISMNLILHWWISTPINSVVGKIFINIVWYMVFHSIGAITGRVQLWRYKRKQKTV